MQASARPRPDVRRAVYRTARFARALAGIVTGAGVWAAGAGRLEAQGTPPLDRGTFISAGSEREHYLRALQLVGALPDYPWSIRPFGMRESERLVPVGSHPWQARFGGPQPASTRVSYLPPTARLFLSTAQPARITNGPTWTGRGLTADVSGGASFRWRSFLALQVDPIAFAAQNAAFDLTPSVDTGIARLRDSRFANAIDHPQRMGSGTYARVDLGETRFALEIRGLAVGASTAAQNWGPGYNDGLVMGAQAGGFPHLFLGSSTPWDTRFFSLQWRYVVGELPQSPMAVPTVHPDRNLVGFVATLAPHGVSGLELGLARVSEFWMRSRLGLNELGRVFVSGSAGDRTIGSPNLPGENQLASAFLRWALPGSGFEMYGELYREDWSASNRQLILRPDDLASFLLGVQFAQRTEGDAVRVVRLELVNGELSAQERNSRGFSTPDPPYIHTEVTQGHTLRGQILGSEDAYQGSSARITVDRYSPSGRRSVSVFRQLRYDWLEAVKPVGEVHPDVVFGVRYDAVRFAEGRDLTLTVMPTYEMNRDLVSGTGLFNLSLGVGLRGWRWR